MSQETIQWLNTNTLIGFTEKRGVAWHYRAEDQGAESNHYVGPVPQEDVLRRLFHWELMIGQVSATVLNENGVLTVPAPDRQAIIRPAGAFGDTDEGQILGIFKSGYQVHQYREWLLESVADILDDTLQIGSAGILKNGAVAWVSVEVPDSITTPSGVQFRPNLIAATSCDGSLATTFQRAVTNVVCDNTMSAALREDGQKIKIRHSRYSDLKLASAREALAIVHTIGEEFSAQVEQLTNTAVSDGDWAKFLDTLAPIPEKGKGKTIAENKRAKLNALWNHDTRVQPWAGTAYGVVQAVNTYEHHENRAHNGKRAERNMLRAVNGQVDKLDRDTLDMLTAVMA